MNLYLAELIELVIPDDFDIEYGLCFSLNGCLRGTSPIIKNLNAANLDFVLLPVSFSPEMLASVSARMVITFSLQKQPDVFGKIDLLYEFWEKEEKNVIPSRSSIYFHQENAIKARKRLKEKFANSSLDFF